jgi:hypothetical protein
VHPAFNFDSTGTTVVSIFIERVQVVIAPDGNSFTGAFTWDSYDFSGHPLPGTHLVGALTGTRITVGAPFPFPFPLWSRRRHQAIEMHCDPRARRTFATGQ